MSTTIHRGKYRWSNRRNLLSPTNSLLSILEELFTRFVGYIQIYEISKRSVLILMLFAVFQKLTN